MNSRFTDQGTSVHDFGDHFLVECPKCARCSLVRVDRAGSRPTATLTCARCGYAKSGQEQRLSAGRDHFDWYFRLPLWLVIPCCGEVLWARNAAHLAFLENFVSAQLRERPADADELYDRNRLLASRLPGWIKDASNREPVLKAIRRLRQRLSEDAA